MTNQNNDFLLDLFETDEQGLRGIFQNFGVGAGRSTRATRISQSMFQPLFNQFLGKHVGEMSNLSPDKNVTKFRDFVGNQSTFNFDKEALKSTDRSFSDASVLGRAGTMFDFGQGKSQQGF